MRQYFSFLTIVSSIIVSAFLFSSCNTQTTQPIQYENVSVAQETIGAIYNAVKMYRQDYGKEPVYLDSLVNTGYIVIPPLIGSNWEFGLLGIPTSNIYSISKYYDNNELRRKFISFDVATGRFSGYRVGGNIDVIFPALFGSMKAEIIVLDAISEYYNLYDEVPVNFQQLKDSSIVRDVGFYADWETNYALQTSFFAWDTYPFPPNVIHANAYGAISSIDYYPSAGLWFGEGILHDDSLE